MSDPCGPLRIGFEQTADASWTGGKIFVSNVRAALDRLDPSRRPQVVTLTRDAPHATGDQVYVPPDNRSVFHRVARRVSASLGRFAPIPATLSALRQAGVQVLFTDHAYVSPSVMPIVSWIPDFQHLHLPEFTPPEGIERAVAYHHALIGQSQRLMVSSHDVLKDLKAFAPEAAARADVVSFVANVPTGVFDIDPSYVCKKFSIPERYFMLPNQFWKHKNHRLVIEAVRLLRDRGVDLTVVCTGNTVDWRNPSYFAALLAEIAITGVHDRLRLLGMVPREDVFQLQRQSLAVLQPSLFEGWSTSLEEAKSLGKRVVASDLSVHLEQIPHATFFARYDAEDLAGRLTDLMEDTPAGPDQGAEAAARAALPERAQRFADAFVATMRKAADG